MGVLVSRREKTGQEDSTSDRWASVRKQLVGLILEHLSLTVSL